MVRHAGAAPAPTVWKTVVLAVTPMTRKKWWLRPVSHRTLLGFSEALIYLSYTARNWSLHEVTLLGRPVIGRVLCF